MVTVNGSVGSGHGKLPGATVCLYTAPSTCTTSDADGAFALTMPSTGSGIVISLQGYATGIWAITAPQGFSFNVILRSTSEIAQFEQEAGNTTFGQTGAVMFFTFDASQTPLSNVTVSSTPAGKNAFFSDGGVDPSPVVTNGAGGGTIFGLPEGLAGLTFTVPGLTCSPLPLGGWPATSPGGNVLVPIKAGNLTVARVTCQ
jgi:hypothetical protein